MERCNGHVKAAVAVQALNISPEEAQSRLDAESGQLGKVLNGGEEL